MIPSDRDPTGTDGRDADHIAQEAMTWLVRLNAGHLGADGWAELERWCGLSEAHRRAFDEACALWDDPALLAALRKAECEAAYLPRRVYLKRGRRLLVPTLATALVLAVLLWLDPWTRLQADRRTAVGERRSLTLEDGSHLSLNTDTAIALDLSANERRLRLLKGELYCEVRPDPGRPFVIEGAASHTRVTGTAFTVLREGGSDTITVLRGQVNVMTPAGETRTLRPMRRSEQTPMPWGSSNAPAALRLRTG